MCVCCNIACISAAMRLIFFLYDLVIVIINMSWPVSELPMKGHTIHCLKWHLNASLSRSNIFYGPTSSSILSNPSVFTNSRIFKRRRKKNTQPPQAMMQCPFYRKLTWENMTMSISLKDKKKINIKWFREQLNAHKLFKYRFVNILVVTSEFYSIQVKKIAFSVGISKKVSSFQLNILISCLLKP